MRDATAFEQSQSLMIDAPPQARTRRSLGLLPVRDQGVLRGPLANHGTIPPPRPGTRSPRRSPG